MELLNLWSLPRFHHVSAPAVTLTAMLIQGRTRFKTGESGWAERSRRLIAFQNKTTCPDRMLTLYSRRLVEILLSITLITEILLRQYKLG